MLPPHESLIPAPPHSHPTPPHPALNTPHPAPTQTQDHQPHQKTPPQPHPPTTPPHHEHHHSNQQRTQACPHPTATTGPPTAPRPDHPQSDQPPHHQAHQPSPSPQPLPTRPRNTRSRAHGRARAQRTAQRPGTRSRFLINRLIITHSRAQPINNPVSPRRTRPNLPLAIRTETSRRRSQHRHPEHRLTPPIQTHTAQHLSALTHLRTSRSQLPTRNPQHHRQTPPS